jgi:hypothetical protein
MRLISEERTATDSVAELTRGATKVGEAQVTRVSLATVTPLLTWVRR